MTKTISEDSAVDSSKVSPVFFMENELAAMLGRLPSCVHLSEHFDLDKTSWSEESRLPAPQPFYERRASDPRATAFTQGVFARSRSSSPNRRAPGREFLNMTRSMTRKYNSLKPYEPIPLLGGFRVLFFGHGQVVRDAPAS